MKDKLSIYHWVILIFMVGGFIFISYKGNRDAHYLNENPVYTKGIVIRTENHRGHSVQYQFRVGSKKYINWSNNLNNRYDEYDTVKIRYFKNYPEISEMVEDYNPSPGK